MTDIGGLNDRSFNFLANKGLEDARVASSASQGRVLPLEVERRLHPEPDDGSRSSRTT